MAGTLSVGHSACRMRSPLSKKLQSLPSSIRRIIQSRDRSCVDPWPSRREIYGNSLPVSTYIRLYPRVDRLEDAISHLYNVINELRRRVSALEKKSKPLAKR